MSLRALIVDDEELAREHVAGKERGDLRRQIEGLMEAVDRKSVERFLVKELSPLFHGEHEVLLQPRIQGSPGRAAERSGLKDHGQREAVDLPRGILPGEIPALT